MLISPPFLPTRQNDVTDEDWIDTAMPPDPQGHGKFPVSFNLGWHGGMHIQAPLGQDGRLPVRAVADGTVVYARQSIESNDDSQHPLNYGDHDGHPVWTSKGCVVLHAPAFDQILGTPGSSNLSQG